MRDASFGGFVGLVLVALLTGCSAAADEQPQHERAAPPAHPTATAATPSASGSAGTATDPADLQPSAVKVAPPEGFVETQARESLPPAAQGWWKRADGCGKGRHMDAVQLERKPNRFSPSHAFVCKNAQGKPDGPHVSFYADETVFEEGTTANGVNQGVRRSYSPEGRVSGEMPWVGGVLEGIERVDTGTVRKETTYRAGRRHGYSREEWVGSPAYTMQGYNVDNEQHGVWWTTWRGGTVVARVEFDHGRIVGSPRWWYPDGRVWARGVVSGESVTWTSDTGPGRYLSELVCKGGELERFQVWERDRTGALLHAECAPGQCASKRGSREVVEWAAPYECGSGAALRVRVWPVLDKWPESRSGSR